MGGVLKNCPYCHKVYLDVREGCCPECKEKREAQRQKVREFLNDNPGADMMTVAKATGLSAKVLTTMTREGFLGARRAAYAHPCKGCGTIIDEGLYCKACVASFAKKRADLAARRLLGNLRSDSKSERREADSKYLSDTYSKYMTKKGEPLLKSDRAKLKRKQSGQGGFHTSVDYR